MPRAARGNPVARVALMSVLVLGGFGCATARSSAPIVTWHPTPPDVIPSGTLLTAQLKQELSTADSHPGDRFTAELLDPVLDGAGQQVLPVGAQISGLVKSSVPSNGLGSRPELELQVVAIGLPGEERVPAPLELAHSPTELTSVAGRTVIGALAGAAVGAGAGLGIDHEQVGVVLGGSLVGLGLGAVAGYFLGPRHAVLPAGSILTLRVMRDLPWNGAGAAASARPAP